MTYTQKQKKQALSDYLGISPAQLIPDPGFPEYKFTYNQTPYWVDTVDNLYETALDVMLDNLSTMTSKEFMDKFGEDVATYLVNKSFSFNRPCEYFGNDTIWLTDDLVAYKDWA